MHYTAIRIIDAMSEQPLVGVVMGSKSDYEMLSAAVEILRALEIPYEARDCERAPHAGLAL